MSAYHVNYPKIEAACTEMEQLRQKIRSVSDDLVTHAYRVSSGGLAITTMPALKASVSKQLSNLNGHVSKIGKAKLRLETIYDEYYLAELNAMYVLNPSFSLMQQIFKVNRELHGDHLYVFAWKAGAGLSFLNSIYKKSGAKFFKGFIEGTMKETGKLVASGSIVNYLDKLRNTKVGDCVEKVKLTNVAFAGLDAFEDVREGRTQGASGFLGNLAARVGTKVVQKTLANIVSVGLTTLIVAAVPVLAPAAPVIKVGLSIAADFLMDKAASSLTSGKFDSFGDMAGYYGGKLGNYAESLAGQGAKALGQLNLQSLFNPFKSVPKALGCIKAFGFG